MFGRSNKTDEVNIDNICFLELGVIGDGRGKFLRAVDAEEERYPNVCVLFDRLLCA